MAKFETEFKRRLKEEFRASDREVHLVTEQAVRFRKDNDREDSPEELIERMEKRVGKGAKEKWNGVIGHLYGPSYSTEGVPEPNPYKLK